MGRVAVTGARGFLGQHVVEQLTSGGHDVVRIGRNPSGELERLDEASNGGGLLDGADAIVHLAAMLSLGPDSIVAEYLDTNVGLTERLALEAAEAGAGAFVFTSSRLVYPSNLGRDAVEGDVGPETAYGLSKLFAEMALERLSQYAGLPSVSLRVSQLVGPGTKNLGAFGAFAERARAGETISVAGSGRAVRDYLDVRDAARAVVLSVDAIVNGHNLSAALNIGGGPTSILELARIANRAAAVSYTHLRAHET